MRDKGGREVDARGFPRSGKVPGELRQHVAGRTSERDRD